MLARGKPHFDRTMEGFLLDSEVLAIEDAMRDMYPPNSTEAEIRHMEAGTTKRSRPTVEDALQQAECLKEAQDCLPRGEYLGDNEHPYGA